MSQYVTLCRVASAALQCSGSIQVERVISMVKRSRSAARLPSDDHADLVPDIVDSQMAHKLPEARVVESIEEAGTHLPTRNSAPATSVGELDRIKPAETHNQCRDSMLQSPVVDQAIEPELVTINVQTLSGELPPITMSTYSTIRDLKLRLQTLNAAFAYDRQKLLIRTPDDAGAGILLLNYRTLQSYHIAESTNVVLVVQPIPHIEVCIDDFLKDTNRFNALLTHPDLHATAIDVSSIQSLGHELLLRKLVENRAIQSVKISGGWTEKELEFCRALLTERPDLDLRFVVESGTCESMLLQVVEFCKVSHCTYLDLSPEGLGDAGPLALVISLQSMPSLQTLRLELSESHLGKRVCRALSTALQSMPLLHTFALVAESFGASGAVALVPALPSLQILELFVESGLAEDVCHAIVVMLQTMSSLQSFDLNSNGIGPEGCVALAPALQSMSSLSKFDISCNYIGAEGCVALAPALQSMSILQTLNLSANEIDDDGCVVLSSALQSMSSLQTLDLSENEIGDAGFRALVHALPSMSSLQKLELGINCIGASGCTALATLTSLKTLNSISEEIHASLTFELQPMSSLLYLGLGSNKIGNECCVALAPVLQSMSSLQTLGLGENQIGDDGCVTLAPVLQSLSSLQNLYLSFNQIGDAGYGALAPTLQSMPSLRDVSLWNNHFGEEGQAAILSRFRTVQFIY